MADMMEYKCPSCGGAMEFDSTTQKMKCPYCDTEMEVAQYQQMQEKAEGNAGGNQGGDAGGNNPYIPPSRGHGSSDPSDPPVW